MLRDFRAQNEDAILQTIKTYNLGGPEIQGPVQDGESWPVRSAATVHSLLLGWGEKSRHSPPNLEKGPATTLPFIDDVKKNEITLRYTDVKSSSRVLEVKLQTRKGDVEAVRFVA